MALSWNVEKIENHEELLVGEGDERELDALTQAFIWTSLATGLGKGWSLDIDFAPEFYARIKLYERVHGSLVRRVDDETGEIKPYWVTPEDVLRRVGLETNVSPVTRAEFIKRMVTNDLDRDKRKAEAVRAEQAVRAGEFG